MICRFVFSARCSSFFVVVRVLPCSLLKHAVVHYPTAAGRLLFAFTLGFLAGPRNVPSARNRMAANCSWLCNADHEDRSLGQF
uniref:Uncharacterized protein n=1 Tax=Anopheles minimus TaxID=112268 RepID=A0A182WPJ8_9DIPT